MSIDWRTILAVAAVVFAAGRMYSDHLRLRKDLNGIGKRQRKFEDRVKSAFQVKALTQGEREWLADHFREE